MVQKFLYVCKWTAVLLVVMELCDRKIMVGTKVC